MTPTVRVFFYGSFINREVLAASGLAPEDIGVARLRGYDIRIDTLATLVRSDEHCVYGIVCSATHAELARLYGQDWVAGAYLPEPVVVETTAGHLVPALTCIAPVGPAGRPSVEYVDKILRPARALGFPEWYLRRLERFRPQD